MDLTLEGEVAVAVAGDWHGNIDWIQKAIPALARESTGIQTILHVGDFGIWTGIGNRRFFDAVDYWCERVGISRILVTPGNHEDWDWLDADFAANPGQPASLSKTVQVLPRGYRFELAGVSFMSFGGAASIDFRMRTAGFDWFLTEIPTESDVSAAIEAGPVDVLITHDAVDGGTDAVEMLLRHNPMRWNSEELCYSAVSRQRVTEVWEATHPRLLLHGHMHAADEKVLADGARVVSLGRDTQRKNMGVLKLSTLEWGWVDSIAHSPRVRRIRNIESVYLTRPTDPTEETGSLAVDSSAGAPSSSEETE